MIDAINFMGKGARLTRCAELEFEELRNFFSAKLSLYSLWHCGFSVIIRFGFLRALLFCCGVGAVFAVVLTVSPNSGVA